MTERRLYELAQYAALQGWRRWHAKAEQEPHNRVAQHGEQRYWAEYKELADKLEAIEAEEKKRGA